MGRIVIMSNYLTLPRTGPDRPGQMQDVRTSPGVAMTHQETLVTQTEPGWCMGIAAGPGSPAKPRSNIGAGAWATSCDGCGAIGGEKGAGCTDSARPPWVAARRLATIATHTVSVARQYRGVLCGVVETRIVASLVAERASRR